MAKYLIKFSDIKLDRIKPGALANLIKENLPLSALLSSDPYTIVYESLKLINIKGLTDTKESIEEYSNKVLRAWLKLKKHTNHSLYIFIGTILQFKALPFLYRDILETEARKDLLKVSALLDHYKNTPFIKSYISEQATPRNHRDATLLVFYNRAEKKLYEIINYINHELNKLAIEGAENKGINEFLSPELEGVFYEVELHRFYPYKDMIYNRGLSCEIDYEMIDYRKINVFRNKMFVKGLGEKIDDGTSAKKLNKLLLKIPANHYFDYIDKKAKALPIISSRIDIFNELRYLFSRKKWYGFYALALPQVEGLFADMLKIVSPEKRLSGALPEKVGATRQHYAMSERFFDYYQYYLPEQRNKFSHTGHDDDIKIKSYHLLIDLWYVIHTFHELKAPLLEVVRAVSEGIDYFENIGSMAHFTTLLKSLHNKKAYQDKEAAISTHLYNFLLSINTELFFENLQYDFAAALDEFDDKFLLLSKAKENGISFISSSKKEIFANIDSITRLFNNSMAFLFEHHAKLLIDVNNFIRNIDTLSDLSGYVPTDFGKAVNEFYETNKIILDKLDILGPGKKIPFEINDHFPSYVNIALTHVEALPQQA